MPLSKAEYKKLVLQFVRMWEKQLDTYNAYILARQIQSWEKVSKDFDKLILELSESSVNLSQDQIFRLEIYKKYKREIERQLDSYAKSNATITSVGQKDFANLAYKNGNTLLNAIGIQFNRLPIESINKMIGFTSDGSPLYDVLKKRFAERSKEAEQILVEGIARGLNPRTVGRMMKDRLEVTRYDATRITRTETINAYTEVNYDVYKASGIVDSYDWIAESDACSECLSRESNSPYPLEDGSPRPTEHPHCRCAITPHV